MLFVCYSLLNSQNISINSSEKKVGYLLTRTPRTPGVVKKAAEVTQKKEQ